MITSQMLTELRCPKCPGQSLELAANQREGDKIVAGTLACSSCGDEYSIRSEVPSLVPADVFTADEWRLWNDHLAGFEERRRRRRENPGPLTPKRATTKSNPWYRRFAEFCGIDRGTVLDIGCGAGGLRQYLGADIEYWGLDPLPPEEVDDFFFVRAVAEYLPFCDNLFTDVIAMSAIDHFRDAEAFCKEVIRVLQPGGRLHVVQSVHEVRGPLTAIKVAAHFVKDYFDSAPTHSQSEDAPKHMKEYDGASVHQLLKKRFDVVAEHRFSKHWYSPENLFLTPNPQSP